MNAPTLIVGLGGAGSKVALRVSKMLNDEQREKIAFAVFDTDVNELRTIKEKNPFVNTIQTSTRLTVGEYLEIDQHSRDTWFPVNAILNSKSLTEGAGQVRAVSRLAFETAIRAGKMEPLHKAIEKLYRLEGNEYEQALRVIIVSSLAGGTGSGLILPVALYIKNYLATRFRQNASITRGFFLLPEVFYGVIPGQAERNNLNSNAYAAIRELDAFLMRGDSTLHDRYKSSVNMEFPIAGTDSFESYNVRPYDFCFLFDAQNADGKQLDSHEEYLDHAANCIYSQSIGPMNKRSNSSEDNTIRKLASEQGRNRYAGAGCSRLVYPVNDVRDYIALNWTKECVSEQWLKFDNQYEKMVKKNAAQRSKGANVADITRSESYVNLVLSEASQKKYFAKSIVNSCKVFEKNSLQEKCMTWESYFNELDDYIKKSLEGDLGEETLLEIGGKIRTAITCLTDKDQDKDSKNSFVETFHKLEDYRKRVEVYCEKSASTIAYSLFRANEDEDIKDTESFQLEHYFKNANGNVLHPNAIRFFLYNVLKELIERSKATEADVNEDSEYFNAFEKNTFSDNGGKDGEAHVNNAESLMMRKTSLIDRISGRDAAALTEIANAYNTYYSKIDSFKLNSILLSVYKEAITYVKEVCDAFESFYKSFSSQINAVEKNINTIERKYNNTHGKAARYVCASKKCLETILEETPYTDGFNEIDGELSQAIYNRIRAYAMDKRNEKNEKFFDELFDNNIVGFFRKSVMKNYNSEINMDIISAIEREAQIIDNCHTNSELELYTKHVFDECKILAAPFIEKPIGEEKHPIPACTYNSELIPNDDSSRSAMLKKELKNFGGEADKDIPLNEILFYKSFYGLRATELSKFAPSSESETCSRTEGPYYRAYFDLISKIHPESHKSKVITPHIDKWWHNVSKMPDIDDENQKKQEYDIYAAFFWGLLSKQIQLLNDGNNKTPVYRISARLVKDLTDKSASANVLVVSNGTPCDNLYEIVDALSIYPELVSKILASKNAIITKELENKNSSNINADSGFLATRLDEFKLLEFPIEKENPNKSRSIFDLPILIKKSTPNELYFEEKVVKLLDVAIEEIKKYVMEFGNINEMATVFGRIIGSEFDKYINFINAEKKKWPGVVNDVLFVTTYDKIIEVLEDLGLDEEVKANTEKYEKVIEN